jgi:adenosylcobinamide amidohydrolase
LPVEREDVHMDLQLRWRREGHREYPALVWRFPAPALAVSSAPHGGGIGLRRWAVNAQVPAAYARRDPDRHLGKLAVSFGLAGRGIGMLTAVDVRTYVTASDGGVQAIATVGLGNPVRAADLDGAKQLTEVGTINLLVVVPERLADGAMVNAVATATEAKAQALADLGIDGTGTPTDAVAIACPAEGMAHAFGGPRSTWGARLARAVHDAVLAGARGV